MVVVVLLGRTRRINQSQSCPGETAGWVEHARRVVLRILLEHDHDPEVKVAWVSRVDPCGDDVPGARLVHLSGLAQELDLATSGELSVPLGVRQGLGDGLLVHVYEYTESDVVDEP
jgi:hypothetical protein